MSLTKRTPSANAGGGFHSVILGLVPGIHKPLDYA